MKQILNGYKEYYYLTEDGKIYNIKSKKYLKIDNNHCYKLITKEGKSKKISLRTLYKLVYNKRFIIDNIKDLYNEQWKPIENTNNIYWVSDKGRVKSLSNYNAIILKPNLINGYKRVDIVQDEIRRSKLISRLVAGAFLKPPATLDMQLHHKNKIRSDNRKENLIWLTPKEHKKEHKKIGS